MTDHQLSYCKVCTKKFSDPNRGLLCSLTGEKPVFQYTCPTFEAMPGVDISSIGVAQYDAELHRASQGKRLANYIIDYMMILAGSFGVLVVYLILVAASGGNMEDLEQDQSFTLVTYAIMFMVMTIYYWLMESVFGATVGKLITHTYVVTKEGTTPSPGTILLRTLCRFVPFEPFSLLASGARGWHDRWTDTYVVNKRKK